MTLTFAETHNMVSYLSKSHASEGINQIIDFLNGSSIKYALTVNPNIYVSSIKQFWTIVAVKKVNDVIRLQALVDKKKVVVTESTIREALHLDDAEGVECLPNEEFFADLAKIGYEKSSTKLTFYKAFFSSQWKFLIHTILQCMPKELLGMNSAHQWHLLVGKGFFGVETPLFKGMLVDQQVAEEGDAEVYGEEVNAGDVAEGDVTAAHGEGHTVAEEPFIPSPTPPTPPSQPSHDIPSTSQAQPTLPQSPQVQPQSPQPQPQPQQDAGISMNLFQEALERRNKVKVLKLRRLQKVKTSQRVETSNETVMDDVSNQGRMIAETDQDAGVVLEDDKEEAKKVTKDAKEDASEPSEVQEVVEVVTTAKIITEVVTAVSKTITAASENITAAEAQVLGITLTSAPARVTAAPNKGKRILVEEHKPLKKQQQIKQDEKYARELEAELNKNIDWDEAIDHVNKKAKEDNVVKIYQAMKRKPQTEAQTRKNMMVYLKNVADFKIDYFKGMSYDDIRPIFERYFDSNVAFLLKTKEQIEEEESRALKRINETPAEKESSKKGKSWMRREDLDALWSLVKERFATTKPKNFSDDFLLVTLGAMFEKPNIHAQIWKNQRSVHGQAKVKSWKLLESCGVQIITFTTTQLILLVERKYPLTRFTLDQMLNAVRLEVEEESEVSLELLRLSAAKPKLMLLINAAKTN
nr:xylulose kinase-1 [Tanacetum cinerariifolium]